MASTLLLIASLAIAPTASANCGGTGAGVNGVAEASIDGGDPNVCVLEDNVWTLDIENEGDIGTSATLYYCHPSQGGCLDWVGPGGFWLENGQVCYIWGSITNC